MRKIFKNSLFVCILGLPVAAQALIPIQFSGGNGTPLTVTFPSPVLFTANEAVPSLYFGIDGVDAGGSYIDSGLSGDLTVSYNGGSAVQIDGSQGNYSGGPLAPDNLFFWAGSLTSPGAAAGDTFLLSAGSFTTSSNVAGVLTSGLYDIYITSGDAFPYDITVSSVPEPSTYALCLGLLGLGLAIWRRRR